MEGIRKIIACWVVLILSVLPAAAGGPGKMNGIMIDCSRLIERHDYYFRLIDFMADWGMNTLMLHFTDDHGCAIALPGMEHLAMPHAFTAQEIRNLVAHADTRGITLIPEVETFGHARYITDQAAHAHLAAGRQTRGLTFNALDPLNPETFALMAQIIKATADLFPGPYLHIGCDEVNLAAFCRDRKLDPVRVWADYVNQVGAIARKHGKAPMFWEDYPRKRPEVLPLLDRSLIPVYWYYRPTPPGQALGRYPAAGFEKTVLAPSLCRSGIMVKPSGPGLENTLEMARALGQEAGYAGLINTIWMPPRYLQGTMYYGIAFSAWAVSKGGTVDWSEFHNTFIKKTFHTELTRDLDHWLMQWKDLDLDRVFFQSLVNEGGRLPEAGAENLEHLKAVNRSASELVQGAARFTPRANPRIWEAMVLSADIVWAVSEALLITNGQADEDRKKAFPGKLNAVVRQTEADWDQTRFPDDPAKRRAKFDAWKDQYLLKVLFEMQGRFGGGLSGS